MEIAMLVLVFLAALGIAAGVVELFSMPIDVSLTHVLSDELMAIWSKYIKFALFVTTFASGLRLQEIGGAMESALGGGAPGQAANAGGQMAEHVTLGQVLLQTYKTIAGSLMGACWTLLVIFGACLLAYVVIRLYASYQPPMTREMPPVKSEHREREVMLGSRH